MGTILQGKRAPFVPTGNVSPFYIVPMGEILAGNRAGTKCQSPSPLPPGASPNWSPMCVLFTKENGPGIVNVTCAVVCSQVYTYKCIYCAFKPCSIGILF